MMAKLHIHIISIVTILVLLSTNYNSVIIWFSVTIHTYVNIYVLYAYCIEMYNSK